MSARKTKPPGRHYRVIERMHWIEGGRPAPGSRWEGGEVVVYEPGDTVYFNDEDLGSIYHKLEAIDDAGRALLEELRSDAEPPALRRVVADLYPEARSILAWGMAFSDVARGENHRDVLLKAIRMGAELPDDFESRKRIADVLEGKDAPKRERGRPQKRAQPPDLLQVMIESDIAEVYKNWLKAFEENRELAWLRFEARRLRQEKPGAAGGHRVHDLGTEEGQRDFAAAITDLGARPCPPAIQGAETARDLALKATAQERKAVWESTRGELLTPSVVARIITRARKSE